MLIIEASRKQKQTNHFNKILQIYAFHMATFCCIFVEYFQSFKSELHRQKCVIKADIFLETSYKKLQF